MRDNLNHDRRSKIEAARHQILQILSADMDASEKADALRHIVADCQNARLHRVMENLTVYANMNNEMAHEKDPKKGPKGEKYRSFTLAFVIKKLENGDRFEFSQLEKSYFPTAFLPKGCETLGPRPPGN